MFKTCNHQFLDLIRLIVAPAQKKNGGRQRGICRLDPHFFLFTWHGSGDPMSCWPTITINIICRWCIIRKFTYYVKKAFDGIYVYQSVTKKWYFITHMYTSLVLKQPIAKVFFGITPFQDMANCLWMRMWMNQWILGITNCDRTLELSFRYREIIPKWP